MSAQKILIIQTSFLGDTVLSTPVIAALRKKYPQAELWMMTTPLSKQLVERDPFLAGVITFDKRKSESGVSGLFRAAKKLKAMNFDRAYSLHRSPRTSIMLALAGISPRFCFHNAKLSFLYTKAIERELEQHDVMRNLSLLRNEFNETELKELAELRLFAPDKTDVLEGLGLLDYEDANYAVLVPASVWHTKMWNWGNFREVAQHLLSQGQKVIILGAPGEEQVCEKVSEGLDVVNLCGKTSISQLMAVIRDSSLVVCNDSMSLHVASAFKRPTVVVFCATSPEFGFGPWKSPALVVEKQNLDCKPCRRHGSKQCPTGTEACMRDLPPSEVISAIEKVTSIDERTFA